jgi:hypothetical protein
MSSAIEGYECNASEINIDGWPKPNEDGTYPNGGDNADTEKPDEIDEMVTDEDVDEDERQQKRL